jgi:hypothetical protein
MKRVLLDFRGVINDVVDIGEEFEIYNGPDATIKWCLCPHDDVTADWHLINGQWIKPEDKLDTDQNMRRKIAYGSIEEQLGTLYWDIINGNLENGEWVSKCREVKESIMSQSAWEADESNWKNKVKLEFHSPEDPCWNHLPANLTAEVTTFKVQTVFEEVKTEE